MVIQLWPNDPDCACVECTCWQADYEKSLDRALPLEEQGEDSYLEQLGKRECDCIECDCEKCHGEEA